jgi:hypothetical protein
MGNVCPFLFRSQMPLPGSLGLSFIIPENWCHYRTVPSGRGTVLSQLVVLAHFLLSFLREFELLHSHKEMVQFHLPLF